MYLVKKIWYSGIFPDHDKGFLQKDKYIVCEINIKVISHTLQNSLKFIISGCKNGWIDLGTFTLTSCQLNSNKDLIYPLYFFMEYFKINGCV